MEMKTLAHSRKARKPQSLWLCTLREMTDGFTFVPDRLVKCMAPPVWDIFKSNDIKIRNGDLYHIPCFFGGGFFVCLFFSFFRFFSRYIFFRITLWFSALWLPKASKSEIIIDSTCQNI